MKILLIAGHGAGDSGAVATTNGKQYREADLTREVVANLKPCLEAYGASVGVYPTSHDAYTDYKNGKLVSNANFNAYDYVLEIHFNAGASDLKGNGKTTGVECFWPSRGKETGVELPMTSRLAKLGYKQRQNRSGQYAVINTAAGFGKKANLLEVCFVDDADDMRIYLKNKTAIAQNIADGVAAYFNLKKKEEKPMAKEMFTDIKNSGFKAEIERSVQLGIFKGNGDGTFSPKEPFTREMAAAVSCRIYDAVMKAIKEGK